MSDRFWRRRARRSSTRRTSKRRRRHLESLEQRDLLALTAAMVADIHPGPAGSNPTFLASESVLLGQSLFFAADDGVHGDQLWHSDGTAAGTSMVKDLSFRRGASSDPEDLTVVSQPLFSAFGQFTVLDGLVRQTLFFTADDGLHGRELWKSDGTAAGTAMVKDILPGAGDGSNPQNLTAIGGTLYFTASDGAGGSALWKTDGSANGTFEIQDFPAVDTLTDLTGVNGALFFNVNDIGSAQSGPSELWKTQGTTATTTDFGVANAEHLTASGGRLYFTTPDPFLGVDLFASNPALSGVAKIDVQDQIADLTDVNGTLFYYFERQGFGGLHNPAGLEKTHGALGGNTLVKDFTNFGQPSNFANDDGTLFFVIDDNIHGSELWRSNGTAAGTRLAADVNPGADGSSPFSLTPVNTLFTHRLFFTAFDAVHGQELWAYDVNSQARVTARLVRDIVPGSGASSPANLTAARSVFSDGTLFFTADDGADGIELWRTANLPAPQIANPGDQANNEGDAVSLPIAASGGSLTYSATGLPAGLDIDPGTGVISGTIGLQAGQANPYNVKVTVSNGGLTASVSFAWTVRDVTPPAVANPGPQSSNEGNTIGLFVTASDADGDPLVYGASGLPDGLSINSSSGLISGTLGNQSAGVYQATVSASDGSSSSQTVFTWTVSDLTVPALTNPGPQVSNEGNKLQLAIGAADSDGDPLTFGASGLPDGLTIDPTSGVISGTLGNQAAGVYQVTVSASDGANAAQVNFAWTVNDITPPAVVNPGDQANQEAQTVQLQIQASDADGDALVFGAANLPTGLSIDPITGLISGTLAGGSAGSYDVQVNVCDGANNNFVHFTWVISRTPGV